MDEYVCLTLLSHPGETRADFSARLSRFWTHLLRTQPEDFLKVYAETTGFAKRPNTVRASTLSRMRSLTGWSRSSPPPAWPTCRSTATTCSRNMRRHRQGGCRFSIDRGCCPCPVFALPVNLPPARPQRQARTSRTASSAVPLVRAWRCGLGGWVPACFTLIHSTGCRPCDCSSAPGSLAAICTEPI